MRRAVMARARPGALPDGESLVALGANQVVVHLPPVGFSGTASFTDRPRHRPSAATAAASRDRRGSGAGGAAAGSGPSARIPSAADGWRDRNPPFGALEPTEEDGERAGVVPGLGEDPGRERVGGQLVAVPEAAVERDVGPGLDDLAEEGVHEVARPVEQDPGEPLLPPGRLDRLHRVAERDVGHLVREHRRELVLAPHGAEQPGRHRHEAAGRAHRVHLR
jgi:hypothetical protein